MEVVAEVSTLPTPVDQYVDVKGVTTRYWSAGHDGSNVVLIHGIGQYVEAWLSNIEALASEHRVYALDVIGYGKTDKPSGASYGLDAVAQFVSDFMDAVGIERAHVVGHSLGGALATRLALKHPEKVNKLVLVDAVGLGRECHPLFSLMSLPIVGELLTRPSRSGSARVLRVAVHDQSCIDENSIELHCEMSSLPGAQKAFLKTLRSDGVLWSGIPKSLYGPHLEGLAGFENPVLVVWGREDKLIPVAHAEVAAKTVPNVTVKIFDSCGHVPMFEYPQEFNTLLLDFLSDKGNREEPRKV